MHTVHSWTPMDTFTHTHVRRTWSCSRSQNMYVPITAMGTRACARSQGLALPPSPTHYRAPPSPWLLSRENPLCPPHARQPGGASPGPPSAPGRSSPCSWPISRGTPYIVAETSSPGASALRGHLPSPHLVTKPSSDWGPTSQSPGPILGAAPEATTTPDPATSPWTSSPVFPGQPEVTQLQEECQATCSTQGAPQIALPQAPSRAFFPELPAPASLEATPPLGLSPCRICLCSPFSAHPHLPRPTAHLPRSTLCCGSQHSPPTIPSRKLTGHLFLGPLGQPHGSSSPTSPPPTPRLLLVLLPHLTLNSGLLRGARHEGSADLLLFSSNILVPNVVAERCSVLSMYPITEPLRQPREWPLLTLSGVAPRPQVQE